MANGFRVDANDVHLDINIGGGGDVDPGDRRPIGSSILALSPSVL
jgi:hypothetical protein